MGATNRHSTSPRSSRLVGRFALGILLAVSAVSTAPLAAQTSAIQDEYRLAVSSDSIRQGLRFSLSVDIPLPQAQNAAVVGLDWPSGLTVLLGPEITAVSSGNAATSTTSASATTATTERSTTRFTWYLRADAAGWKFIPGFSIRNGFEQYLVSETALPILPAQGGTTVPPNLTWRVPSLEVVQGQSVPVILELSRMSEYVLPETVSFSPPGSGVFEEVTGLGNVSARNFGAKVFQSYPAAAFILTPTESGTLVIPDAAVTVLGQRVQAPSLQIQVRTQPPQLAESSAIGAFSLSAQPAADSVRLGEVLRFTLRLEGEGNFNYLSVPQPSLVGGRISGQTEAFRLNPAQGGYRGFREITYRIIPEREGSMSILVPAFRWFDPQDQRMNASSAQSFAVVVDSAVINTQEGQAGLSPLSPAVVQSLDLFDFWRRPESYILLLPPAFIGIGLLVSGRSPRRGRSGPASSILIVLLVFGVIFLSAALPRRGLGNYQPAEQLERLQSAAAAFQNGDPEAAVEIYRQLIDQAVFSNPGLLYNQGIFLAAADRSSESVFMFRTALRTLPSNAAFRRALQELETSLELTRQNSIPRLPAGDYFFAVLLLTLVTFFLFLPFWLRKLNSAKIVGLTLIAVLAIASASILGVYSSVRFADEAIVRGGEAPGQVKKIPEPEASTWLQLPPGTSVTIGDWSGDFALISTAYGIEGWITRDALWVREDIEW